MKKVIFTIMIMAVMLQGCASMSPGDRAMYKEIEEAGAQCKTVADPGGAAVLNILPGFGDIYLATGQGANPSSWGAFVLDLLFWPIGVVWSVPQAIITANEINKIECAGYYRDTEAGRLAFAKLKNGTSNEAVTIEKKGESTATVQQDDDNIDKLKDLKKMHDDGLITKEEYESKKKIILEKI